MQQSAQTDATCDIQQRCVRLHVALERWTCYLEALSSSPALTASWICSR